MGLKLRLTCGRWCRGQGPWLLSESLEVLFCCSVLVCTCVSGVCVEVRSYYFPFYMGPGDYTQVIRCSSKHWPLLNHLASP